jgi:hypothetical protein
VDCLNDERCSDCEIIQEPPDFTINVRWAYDRTDSSWGSSTSVEESWEFEAMEASKPLASHPYFAAAYVAGAGKLIMDDIVKADYAIATGQKPDVSGDYAVWMKRYAGLKAHGVDDWVPHGVILRRKTRVYKSLPDNVWKGYYENVHRSFLTSELPASIPNEITLAIEGLTFPVYDDAGGIDPTGTSDAKLVWVKKAPQFQMVGRNPKGPRDVVETWIGGQYISAVHYPSAIGTCADNDLWDPQEA